MASSGLWYKNSTTRKSSDGIKDYANFIASIQPIFGHVGAYPTIHCSASLSWLRLSSSGAMLMCKRHHAKRGTNILKLVWAFGRLPELAEGRRSLHSTLSKERLKGRFVAI